MHFCNNGSLRRIRDVRIADKRDRDVICSATMWKVFSAFDFAIDTFAISARWGFSRIGGKSANLPDCKKMTKSDSSLCNTIVF